MVSFIVRLCIWINKRGHWPHLLKKCWKYPSGRRKQEAATPGCANWREKQGLLARRTLPSYNCACICLGYHTARGQESTRYGRGQKKGLRLFRFLYTWEESGVQDPDASLLLRKLSHRNTGVWNRSPFCANENAPVLQSQAKSCTGYWSVSPSSLFPSFSSSIQSVWVLLNIL